MTFYKGQKRAAEDIINTEKKREKEVQCTGMAVIRGIDSGSPKAGA